jgi:hypothetical protein
MQNERLELPKGWTVSNPPEGKTFTFTASKAPGAIAALAIGITIIALSLYWDVSMLKEWIFDGYEVLIGGLVLFVLALGALWFGFYCLSRYFGSTRYVLAKDDFHILNSTVTTKNRQKMPKAALTAIALLFTPSKEQALKDMWSVVLTFTEGLRTRTIPLEGYDETIAKILSGEISTWSGVKVHKENTST